MDVGQEGEDEDPGGEDSGDEGSGEKDDEEEVGPMDTKPLNLRVTWPAMSMAPQLAGKGVGELLDKVVIEPLSVQVRRPAVHLRTRASGLTGAVMSADEVEGN